MAENQPKLSILLVDDSADDRFFLKRVLARHRFLQICGEARDGQEAIDYLKGEAEFTDRVLYPLPDLMILDLKMPRTSGFEVLAWLKDSSSPLPTFVLSGSTLEEDRLSCLELGAKGFSSKTYGLRDDRHVIHEIERWYKLG